MSLELQYQHCHFQTVVTHTALLCEYKRAPSYGSLALILQKILKHKALQPLSKDKDFDMVLYGFREQNFVLKLVRGKRFLYSVESDT